MSSEAVGWVYRHSPAKGAAFAVHLAIADTVNDQGENEFYMACPKLARKARLGLTAVKMAVAELVDAGLIERLTPPQLIAERKPIRYRFVFFDTAPVVFDSRRTRSRGDLVDPGTRSRGDLALGHDVTSNPIGTQEVKTMSFSSNDGVDFQTTATTDKPVRAVFDAWVDSTGKPRATLDDKRRRRIVWALGHYPVDDVIAAVRGWQHSPHHRGENDRRTVYNDLTLLLRDADHLERFRDLGRAHVERDGIRTFGGMKLADWVQ